MSPASETLIKARNVKHRQFSGRLARGWQSLKKRSHALISIGSSGGKPQIPRFNKPQLARRACM
jgi:hypothetical protein